MSAKPTTPTTRAFSKTFSGWLNSDYARIFFLLFVPSILGYIFFFAPFTRPYGLVERHAEETALPQQGIQASGEEESPYKRHLEAVKNGCGDICRIDMAGSPSFFHDYIEKNVDCHTLVQPCY
jgi:hypothetical protein